MADYDFLLADEWEDASCDCPTAPRQFLIPPPPPPPAMGVCGGAPLGPEGRSGGYFCHLEPMGAEFTQAGFPSLPIIAVCSSVVLVAVLVACFLLWRHKTKVQNLLPSKLDHPAAAPGANGVTYEDVLINHHPTRLPLAPGSAPMVGGQTLMPIELLDVKLGDMVPQDGGAFAPGSFYQTREAPRLAKPYQHPVYEEILREHPGKNYDSDVEGRGGGRSFTSEDEFAEDELSGLECPSGECSSRHCSATSSVQGSTGGDLCRDPVSSDEGAGDECEFEFRRPEPPKTFQTPDRTGLKQFLLPPRGTTATGQWCPPPPPVCHLAPSAENIYSTIDEGDVVDGGHQPSLTPSRTVTTGPASSKRGAAKKQGEPQLSQRNEEDTESYGDILPAYDPASCTT